MRVVKRHKRLWIIDENDSVVYTPPNFIVMSSRQPLIDLARRLSNDPDNFQHIIDFESDLQNRPDLRKNRFRHVLYRNREQNDP